MPSEPSSATPLSSSRREFIQAGTAASLLAVGSVAASVRGAEPEESSEQRQTVRIGLVGAGGRGGGAINNNLTANDNVQLTAIADVNARGPESVLRSITGKYGPKVAVSPERVYIGLDGYRHILDDPEIDLVLFATPPGFRPRHILDAVEAGKHVFAEKPTCVDPAGWHICQTAHKKAEANGTAIVTGTQYRRQTSYVEAINRIHEGAIGDIVSSQMRYCANGIWYRNRKEGMSDTEYQIHNWMHFIWLSGDQIAEQAVHNIDAMNWVMGGPPESAYGGGGRFTRPEDSQMWDNMAIDYIYPGNRMCSFMCRQVPNTDGDNSNIIYGTKGTMTIYGGNRGSFQFDREGQEVWSMEGDINAAYEQEHRDLVASIVSGQPIVELRTTADSSLTAVLGRMAAYTGRNVTWEFATKESRLNLFPEELDFDGPMEQPSFAVPGEEALI